MTWEEAETDFRQTVQARLDSMAAQMAEYGSDVDSEVVLIRDGTESTYRGAVRILDDLRSTYNSANSLHQLHGRPVSAEGGCYSYAERCQTDGKLDEAAISEYAGSGYGTLKRHVSDLMKLANAQ